MAKMEPPSLDTTEPWHQAHFSAIYSHVTRSSPPIRRHDDDWVTKQDEDGDTLLHIAVAQGNEPACLKLIEILKERKLSFDIRNKLMQTPLHVACIADKSNIADLLLKAHPVSCSVTDRHGNNCVHLAIKNGNSSTHHATLRVVMKWASKPAAERKNIYGLSPAHTAAVEGNAEAVRLLKQAGTDLNILDNKGGASPIILAARASQREAAQALLELGANPNLRTAYGESASLWASTKGDHAMAELLALYDTPYDVSKQTVMLRYPTESYGTSADELHHREHALYTNQNDIKMKSFVHRSNVSYSDMSSSELRKTTSPSKRRSLTQHNKVPFVKREFTSLQPGMFFGRFENELDVVESETQPINYTMKKSSPTKKTVDVPSTSRTIQRSPKRALEETGPLDLSVKNKKSRQEQPVRYMEQVSLNRRSNYAIVHPMHHQSQISLTSPRYFYEVAPPTTTISHASSHPATVPPNKALHNYPYTTASKHLQEVVQLVDRPIYGGHQPMALPPFELRGVPQPIVAQTTGYLELPKDSIIGRLKPPAYIKKPITTRVLEQRSYINSITTARNKAQEHPEPIVSRSPEPRFSSKPFTEHWNKPRDSSLQIAGKYVDIRDSMASMKNFIEACDQHRPIRECSDPAYEFRLPPHHKRSHSNQFIQSTSSKERGYYTPNENIVKKDNFSYGHLAQRPSDRISIFRRNSVPVDGKPSSDKLDLRSYTGCLPPHYLHLLESSGNLPIKATNALRTVADVLRDDITVTKDRNIKEETTDKDKKTVKLPLQKDSTDSVKTACSKVSSSSSFNTISPCATPPCIASSNVTQASASSKSFDFEGLADWSSFERGEYPAFDLPYKLSNSSLDKVFRKPALTTDFRVNQKYITESTKAVLRSVTKMPKKPHLLPQLECVVATNDKNKHKCVYCEEHRKKKVPDLIENIWKYTPSKKYVIASSVSNWSPVYCGQKALKFSCEVKLKEDISNEQDEASPRKEDELDNLTVRKQRARKNSLDAKLEHLRKRALIRRSDNGARASDETQPMKRSKDFTMPNTTSGKPPNTSFTLNDNEKTSEILVNSIEESSADECDEHADRPENGMNSSFLQESIKSSSNIRFSTNCYKLEKKRFKSNHKNRVVEALESATELKHKSADIRQRIRYKSGKNGIINTDDIRLSDLEISDDEELLARIRNGKRL